MKKLALLDFCLPDYFKGYHLPVLQIPVFETITNFELSEDLQSEFNFCFDMFEDVPEFESLLDSFCSELLQSPLNVFVEQTKLEEDEEPMCLYFSIIEPKTVNGITFLN